MRTVCQLWHFGPFAFKTCTTYLAAWGHTIVVTITTHRVA